MRHTSSRSVASTLRCIDGSDSRRNGFTLYSRSNVDGEVLTFALRNSSTRSSLRFFLISIFRIFQPYLLARSAFEGSISFAKFKFVIEYSCPKYMKSSLFTLLVMVSTVATISAAVPSKNRPQPPWNNVSPTKTALGPLLDLTMKQP